MGVHRSSTDPVPPGGARACPRRWRALATAALAPFAVASCAQALFAAAWRGVCWCALVAGAVLAQAAPAADTASDPALEARVNLVSAELRCLVCQNQSLADSHASLALDLKDQVREQLRAGRSDQQVIDYMTARYGDFVRYRPALKASTWLLWFGPPLVLLLGGWRLWRRLGAPAGPSAVAAGSPAAQGDAPCTDASAIHPASTDTARRARRLLEGEDTAAP